MRYPAFVINREKLKSNTAFLVEKCKRSNISVVGVTKGFCAIPEAAEAMVEGGASMLADSRIANLAKLKNIRIPKVLLRIPMLSELEDVVEYSDISLNSEYKVIEALSNVSIKKNKVHKIILMIDLGDLREGLWGSEIIDFVGKILNFKGVQLIGLGTNLTCFGGVIPSKENIGQLIRFAEEIEKKYCLKLDILSGGNSSSLVLLDQCEMPDRVNQLRLGESILMGIDTVYRNKMEGTHSDVFKLYAEIVELKQKPSLPIGEIGVDGFGQVPVFKDKGIRTRAILAIGKQDIKLDGICPSDPKIEILGANSDHLVLDITDSEKKYQVGSTVEFNMNYAGLLAAATSNYVFKYVK